MTPGLPAGLLTKSRSLHDLLAFQRYVVVGANSGGDQVRIFLNRHEKSIAAFTDLNAANCGVDRNGIGVRALKDIRSLVNAETAFVVGTVRQREAAAHLVDDLGAAPERVFPFVNPMFAPHYDPVAWERLAQRLAAVRTNLSDEPSRAYFDRVTAFYRTLDSRYLVPNDNRIGHYGYDAPGANPRSGDTIIDCGAFTGDTFADFLQATGGRCKIFALEAFLPNLERLVARIAELNLKSVVTPLHVAAANRTGSIVMSGDEAIADGGATSVAHRAGYRDVVLAETMDNLFLKHIPQQIDYLKLDIEGADLDALKGADQLLREHRPVVAAAAYHCPDHVADIAEYLTQALHPCRLYAAHDPAWVFHIHYIAVPEERAVQSKSA